MDEQYLTQPEIERTVAALTSRHPAFGAHERFITDRLAELAHRCYLHGQSAARLDLYTTDQAADMLGVSRRRVQQLARSRALGWDTGRDIVLTSVDIEAMRVRVPGRPHKE